MVNAEQRCACLDLVGWATSDGAAHVLSCGYRGAYPHNKLSNLTNKVTQTKLATQESYFYATQVRR
jgi:hypothetical protein